MKRKIMAIGAVLAWAGAALAVTHEGVLLWENGPLWAKTNVGANSPTEAGYYFWWGDTLGYKWQNSQWVASDGSVNNFSFSTANCPTYGKSLAQYNIDSSITFTPLANVTGYVFNGWNPASIPAGGFGAAAVTVSWQPVAGAVYYRVYRGTRTGSDYAVEIDTTTETSYADLSGAAGKTYYYSVTAVGASSESGFSAFVAGSR